MYVFVAEVYIPQSFRLEDEYKRSTESPGAIIIGSLGIVFIIVEVMLLIFLDIQHALYSGKRHKRQRRKGFGYGYKPYLK